MSRTIICPQSFQCGCQIKRTRPWSTCVCTPRYTECIEKYKAFSVTRQIKGKASKLHKLCPFLADQGVLREGGRLIEAALQMWNIQRSSQETVMCQHYLSSTIMRKCTIRDGGWLWTSSVPMAYGSSKMWPRDKLGWCKAWVCGCIKGDGHPSVKSYGKDTRSVLMSILDQSARQLVCFSLRNFLYEVMAVVNSRPLTTDQLNDSSSAEPQTTSWPWNPGLSPHLPGSLSMKIFTSARGGAEFNS